MFKPSSAADCMSESGVKRDNVAINCSWCRASRLLLESALINIICIRHISPGYHLSQTTPAIFLDYSLSHLCDVSIAVNHVTLNTQRDGICSSLFSSLLFSSLAFSSLLFSSLLFSSPLLSSPLLSSLSLTLFHASPQNKDKHSLIRHTASAMPVAVCNELRLRLLRGPQAVSIEMHEVENAPAKTHAERHLEDSKRDSIQYTHSDLPTQHRPRGSQKRLPRICCPSSSTRLLPPLAACLVVHQQVVSASAKACSRTVSELAEDDSHLGQIQSTEAAAAPMHNYASSFSTGPAMRCQNTGTAPASIQLQARCHQILYETYRVLKRFKVRSLRANLNILSITLTLHGHMLETTSTSLPSNTP